jgi:stage V sporulation protein G
VEITEVRIKLMEGVEDRLRGFCSITFDNCFVVRDLKIIQGNNGPFVAMPSRKLTSNCPKCRTKNHLRAHFCNHCGEELKNVQLTYDPTGRAKLYADIAHPVNARCREMIQKRIIEELNHELELASKPGYRSRYDDDYDEDFDPVDYTESSKTAADGHSVKSTANPVEADNQNSKDTPPDNQTTARSDAASSSPPAPHDGPKDLNRATPPTEDFGKGVF